MQRATDYLLNQNENPSDPASEEAKGDPQAEGADRPPVNIMGIQNLFAELLHRAPRPAPEDEPPEEGGSDSEI